MAFTRYQDFLIATEEVQYDETGLVSKFSVTVVDSPVGRGEKKETVVVPAELPDMVRNLSARRLDDELERQIELGETLADLALPPYARQMFAACLCRLMEGEGLRLRLRLADALQDFPWEYLYIQGGRDVGVPGKFLALDPRFSIVRDWQAPAPSDWFSAPPERGTLIAMASPQPYSRYPVLQGLPGEQAILRATLDQVPGLHAFYLPEDDQESLDQSAGASLDGLLETLMSQERIDIFHFVGHAESRPGSAAGDKLGGIVLAGQDNRASPLLGDRLGEVLCSRGVRLALLAISQDDHHRQRPGQVHSVAASLLKGLVPAVIVMQFPVKDDLAAAFSGAFYRALVAGYPLDYGLAVGRIAMLHDSQGKQAQARDWGAPLLYLRPGTGMVFNPVGDERASRAAALDLSQLVEQHALQASQDSRMLDVIDQASDAGESYFVQRVDEWASGVVIGGYRISQQDGGLLVDQQAGSLNGDLEREGAHEQALVRLKELLLMDVPGLGGAYNKGSTPGAHKSTLICPMCGNTLHPGAKFCDDCGSPLPKMPKFCTNCAARLDPGARFCVECGAKV